VISSEGIPPNSVVLVRAGRVQLQGKIDPGQPFRFPSLPLNSNPFKVQVLQPVCHKSITLSPDADLYAVKLPRKSGSSSLELQIREASGSSAPVKKSKEEHADDSVFEETAQQPSLKEKTMANAREYLQEHSIEATVHEMLAEVVRGLPTDPYAFMAAYARKQQADRDKNAGIPST